MTRYATIDRSVTAAPPRKRAIGWLLFLGPFFFASYGLSNWLASSLADVGSIVFGWESHIPFLPWTIVPYWSIDLLYAASFFVCATRAELDTHAWRLLLAQIVAVLCFLLFPLRFTFERPETKGLFGVMFNVLMGFDKPFNQAPSLHIALLIILWALYTKHLERFWRWALNAWFALIGASVLTTYQHHFIDIPTGVWLGWLCIWAIPERGRPSVAGASLTRDPTRLRLALRYTIGGTAFGIVGLYFGSWALWLVWIGGSLLMVGSIYAYLGSSGFQKNPNGSMGVASLWLLAPYFIGAWINSRLWTRHNATPAEVVPGVWIGRLPGPDERGPCRTQGIVDLSAELPCRVRVTHYANVPVLDLVVPTTWELDRAARMIDATLAVGPTLVCCALGYSRSAVAVAAWLLMTGRAAAPSAAIEWVRRARPNIVLCAEHVAALEDFAALRAASVTARSGRRPDLYGQTHGVHSRRADRACCRLALSPVMGRLTDAIARLITGVSLTFTGAQTRWIGCTPAATQRIYFSNHASHADFVLIWASLPRPLRARTRPVAGADYWEKCAVRRFLIHKVLHGVLIDRTAKNTPQDPVDTMAAALAQADSLILFPEGTRNTTEAPLLPFRSGLFHLASRCPHVELVPVWLENLGRFLPKGEIVPVPLLCSINFGTPIHLDAGEMKADFLDRAQKVLLDLAASVRPRYPGEHDAHSRPDLASHQHRIWCSRARLHNRPRIEAQGRR